ncbi:MAG: flippase-like domain-containing protein [Lachnospiraceae bacterium]|nr:flippase-like domain-containing protein [Lachnospiraceae bacterium]
MKSTNLKKAEPKKRKSSWKKTAVKTAGLFLGLLILWFMVKDIIIHWEDIVPYLANMKFPLFLLSIMVYGVAFLFTGYNWSWLLWKMEKGPGRREYLDVHMVSALARYIPGGIWSIVGKAYLCNRKGVTAQAATASIILEYVFQIISSSLFFVVLVPFLLQGRENVWLIPVCFLAVVAALLVLPLCINWGIRLLSRILKKDCGDICLKKGFVYQALFRYAGAWLVTGAGLIVLVLAFSDINAMEGIYLMLSYPVSWVVGFLSPSPNGMGIREGILRILLGDRQAKELVLLIVVTTRIWTILGEAAAFLGFKAYYLATGRKGKDVKISES